MESGRLNRHVPPPPRHTVQFAHGASKISSPAARVFSHIAPDEINDGLWPRESARDGFKITVELSSVNRKQTEISVNLPRELEMLEAPIRDVINRHIARGRVTVRVSLHAAEGKPSARMHLNVPLAKAYARELNRLAKQLKLPGR